MTTTAQKLRNMRKAHSEKSRRISKEETIFTKLQEAQININSHPIGLELSEYDLEAPYIRGEFYAIIDKNLYTIHDDVNFQIARTQEEVNKGKKPFGYQLQAFHYKQRL
jgi:hypothetical protein